MRALFVLFFVLFLLYPISAQENKDLRYDRERGEVKTLFGNRQVSHGGYGAIGIGYSQIDNRDAIIMSSRGAWIIGHWFALGFAGAGFINDIRYNDVLGENVNLTGGYGGLLLEPIILPTIPIHISAPVLFAVGGMAYTTSYGSEDWYEPNYWVEDATSFILVEPGIELEFNVVRFFRLAFGTSYRFTPDITLYDTRPDVLNGWTYSVTMKFGKF